MGGGQKGILCVWGKALQLPCPTATGPSGQVAPLTSTGSVFCSSEHQLADGTL